MNNKNGSCNVLGMNPLHCIHEGRDNVNSSSNKKEKRACIEALPDDGFRAGKT